MLDRFVHGRVDRISPEAPVPVVQVQDQEERLGGAANVALNAASLGAQVQLFGVIGPGEAGETLRGQLEGVGDGLVEVPGRVTTLKTRILGGGQQIARIDRETRQPLADHHRSRLLDRFEAAGPFDVIIVSDYSKGVVDRGLMDRLRSCRQKGAVVVADPKQGSFELYHDCTCITPNAKEAGDASHCRVEDDASAQKVAADLRERLGLEMLLLTRGDQGMTLVDAEQVMHLTTESTEVFDVTGAGDTVIATFALFLAAGWSPAQAARAANVAAGLVIRELGTAVVGADRLGAQLKVPS